MKRCRKNLQSVKLTIPPYVVRNERWRLLSIRLLFLAILFSSSPVSAQWSIEESQQTDPLASRPTATAAALVSNDGRLAWEYTCVRTASGRYTESLELYTERSGEQFRGGTIRYRFDDGEWQRARWNSGGSWLGFHSDEEMRRFLDMLRRYRSLSIELETNGGQVTTAFNLLGTAVTLDEIAYPVQR